jgi:uncharacterized protein (TIGR00661 family)
MSKILISPANFGLGHATRDIPIIRELLSKNHTIDIATNGSALTLLKKEFPYLDYYTMPNYHTELQSVKHLPISKVVAELKYMDDVFKEETRIVEKLNTEKKYDLIISDGRYGVYSKKSSSIILSHQLRFKLKSSLRMIEPLTEYFNNLYFKNFDNIIVPDNGDEEISIAGELSHPTNKELNKKLYYTGVLSSIDISDTYNKQKNIDVLVILSGPEPYRSTLENIVLNQIKDVQGKKIIILGKPDEESSIDIGYNTEILSHVNRKDMANLINTSKIIVSRSGYTTMMEMANIKIPNALLIPTPGCGEQEYLSERSKEKGWFLSKNQDDLNLLEDLSISKNYSGFPAMPSSEENVKKLYSEILNQYV